MGGILSVRCNAGPAEGPGKILKYRSNLRLYPANFGNKLCILIFIILSIWPNFFDPPLYWGKTFWSPLSGNSKLFWPPLHFAQPPHQSIYERSLSLLVCLFVCLPAMHFVMLRGIELKVGMGVGDWLPRIVGIFSKRPHLESKVIQGSICLKNALWPPNLVSRPSDQSVVHCWGQMLCRGHLGSARGQIT